MYEYFYIFSNTSSVRRKASPATSYMLQVFVTEVQVAFSLRWSVLQRFTVMMVLKAKGQKYKKTIKILKNAQL